LFECVHRISQLSLLLKYEGFKAHFSLQLSQIHVIFDCQKVQTQTSHSGFGVSKIFNYNLGLFAEFNVLDKTLKSDSALSPTLALNQKHSEVDVSN
jgi:hypothetical protein